MNSHVGKNQVLKTKTGLAQQHLNVGAMKRMLVPLPTLEVQKEVVEICSTIDKKIEMEINRKGALYSCFSSLLTALMKGTMRIKDQDLRIGQGVAA